MGGIATATTKIISKLDDEAINTQVKERVTREVKYIYKQLSISWLNRSRKTADMALAKVFFTVKYFITDWMYKGGRYGLILDKSYHLQWLLSTIELKVSGEETVTSFLTHTKQDGLQMLSTRVDSCLPAWGLFRMWPPLSRNVVLRHFW